jgi:hypothetical protein
MIRLIKCFKVIVFKSLEYDATNLSEPADVATAAASSNDPLTNQAAIHSAVSNMYRFHALRVMIDVLQNLYIRYPCNSAF